MMSGGVAPGTCIIMLLCEDDCHHGRRWSVVIHVACKDNEVMVDCSCLGELGYWPYFNTHCHMAGKW